MITSIFSKSKPINIIIVVVVVILLFVITNYTQLFNDLNNVLLALSKLGITLFLIFLLDFIVSKNDLTQRNSYTIMTFGLLFGLFPQAMKYSDLLLSNLFVFFALRRLISLHSKLSIKKKLFDAAFWIALATLFYFWSILFFALVLVALIYYSQNDIKNTLVPLTGLATVMVLLMVYNIFMYDVFIRPSNFERYTSLDYTPYNSTENILKLTVLFTSYIWILIYYFRTLSDKNKKLKPSYFIIAWASIIAVLVAIIAPIKNGSEFLFLFAPFSIIMANYMEVITERWFKEVFIGLLIITPIIALLL
ncbi:hypothetical protein H8K90_05005 [Winogradskyella echinorum]|uniref:Beta-carotene 15,15'-monooxygenase n=1 Tax=Winogradskyella echinorum TaxID=538189 RepID=A0ABR6XZ09_9FLAO|nr:DUF6427 family protein [Winogradskyella echinorum]MBC3845726.1 hypothetical protein [Winogradskyella echinorum]MBC5750074.1 hypothetical protein [Winogradskyella echinorum]